MKSLPNYVGPAAFGIKLPVIQPGDNIEEIICSHLEKCAQDSLLEDNSIVCISESIIARSQKNYVKIEDISYDVTNKLNLNNNSKIGVLFPIASRNRFSTILKGIAKAIPNGEVYVQFPKEKDEVGNIIKNHPITKINYSKLYADIIKKEGPTPFIIESNMHNRLKSLNLDGIIVSSIHTRDLDLEKVKKYFKNSITLQDICNEQVPGRDGWSEWGVLGSNLAERGLKLAPRNSEAIVLNIQKKVKRELNKNIEVLINGDGAYKDPSTGIYELADPVVTFGYTPNLEKNREGIKYKLLADKYSIKGFDRKQIEKLIEEESKNINKSEVAVTEGTTPRPLKDIAGSLADLVSGSADAGTPVVIIRGLYK